MPLSEYAYIEDSSSGVTNMGLRILTWLFPWLMAILEFLLRASVSNADAVAFVGPTVGGAALGMILPLTVSDKRSDSDWAQWINVLQWVGLTAWAYSLYLSINRNSPYLPNLDGVQTSILIGSILWACAVVLDFLRGRKP